MTRLNDPHAVAAFVRQRRMDLNLSQATLVEMVGVAREWAVRLRRPTHGPNWGSFSTRSQP